MTTFGEIAAELARTVDEAEAILDDISDAAASKPRAPGKWTRKEVLGHLIDSALNNHQRFVRAALQGDLTFPGYDQDGLVVLERFNAMHWTELIEFWVA